MNGRDTATFGFERPAGVGLRKICAESENPRGRVRAFRDDLFLPGRSDPSPAGYRQITVEKRTGREVCAAA